MSNAVKLLVSAFESSGKSTITSQLKDALVFNFDHKEYSFRVPHVNIKEYQGIDNLIELISQKIELYQEKMGSLPKTVVFDTVTQLYSSMQRYNGDKYKGFDEHRQNNLDTLAFNSFVEDSLIPSDINVVIVAHTMYDESTSRYTIPATGAFKNAGSWLSVVNDSVFIEKKANKLVVHTNNLKFPSRTTLQDLPTGVDIESYSLQDHLDQLNAVKIEAADFSL
jgi:hypothetical protein